MLNKKLCHNKIKLTKKSNRKNFNKQIKRKVHDELYDEQNKNLNN